MAKGVKTRNIESFREGLMEYAYGRCSQAQAAKIAGMSVPTFRKYANMHFLGIPFPDTLFKARLKEILMHTRKGAERISGLDILCMLGLV